MAWCRRLACLRHHGLGHFLSNRRNRACQVHVRWMFEGPISECLARNVFICQDAASPVVGMEDSRSPPGFSPSAPPPAFQLFADRPLDHWCHDRRTADCPQGGSNGLLSARGDRHVALAGSSRNCNALVLTRLASAAPPGRPKDSDPDIRATFPLPDFRRPFKFLPFGFRHKEGATVDAVLRTASTGKCEQYWGSKVASLSASATQDFVVACYLRDT